MIRAIHGAAPAGACFIVDPSNDDARIERVWLRQSLLPLWRARWPGLDTGVARSASLQGALADSGESAANDALARVRGPAETTLDVDAILQLEVAARGDVLRAWFLALRPSPPGALALAEIESTLLQAREDSEPCVVWAGAEIRRYRRALYAMPSPRPEPDPGWCIRWDGKQSLDLPGGGMLWLAALEPGCGARQDQSTLALENQARLVARFCASFGTCVVRVAGGAGCRAQCGVGSIAGRRDLLVLESAGALDSIFPRSVAELL